jgi:hypothetical protein
MSIIPVAMGLYFNVTTDPKDYVERAIDKDTEQEYTDFFTIGN